MSGLPPTVARRHRPSRLRAVLVALTVLAGLLVVADRAALAIAERAAAVTLQRSEHLEQRPSVTIAGFPFLTQLATGDYDRIRVRAKDVPVGDESARLRIEQVDVALHDVHVARNFSSGRSQSATASALIAYSDLSDSLGARFAYDGNGRVRASGTVSVGGIEVQGSATAAVRLDGNRLAFRDEQVEIEDVAVPPEVTSYFTNLFSTSISLAGLPFAVQVRELRARADGIAITLTARGLTFSR